ncbi:MAG: hypothetical protein M3R27_04685 [Bacteroidota bacterium]|nr:hypothetical protein [Bacteroidota bacterium]
MGKRSFILFGILFNLSISITNAQQSSGQLSIGFHHWIDSLVLNLDSAVYQNQLGQTFTVGNFKYYLSNIHLKKADGNEYISNQSFLINEDEETSKNILLDKIPGGEYVSISFIIGVDSAHNCLGAQSGALDPVNAMFWAWNTGYIFMKLEGKSSSSTATGKIIEYHIGGFKSPSNAIRNVTIKFEQPLMIEKNKTAKLKINVNAAEILRSPTDIDFTNLPVVVDSKNATTIADNYMDMFSIQK